MAGGMIVSGTAVIDTPFAVVVSAGPHRERERRAGREDAGQFPRGAALLRIADQSQHKSLDALRGYVPRADMFKDHAGAMFL